MFQALEDNQVALSAMKASRFVKAFEKDVDHWERCLSLILEVIEMVLTVQRQWMYLEVRVRPPGLPPLLWHFRVPGASKLPVSVSFPHSHLLSPTQAGFCPSRFPLST